MTVQAFQTWLSEPSADVIPTAESSPRVRHVLETAAGLG